MTILRSWNLILGTVLLAATTGPARAARPDLAIRSDAELRFGSFVVFSSGSRNVKASGAVTDAGLVAAGREPAGPASFTVQYDRGNEARKPIDLVIQLQLLTVPPLAARGISGSLGAFETDLPGYPRIAPGSVMTIAINGCTTRICSRSFRVGATLNVTRAYGGGKLSLPLPLSAVLVSLR